MGSTTTWLIYDLQLGIVYNNNDRCVSDNVKEPLLLVLTL